LDAIGVLKRENQFFLSKVRFLMQAQNRTRLLKLMPYLLGVVGASVLISFPGEAQVKNHCSSGGTQATTVSERTSQNTPGQNIVTIASGNASFSTLTKAVQAAGLAQTLSGEGPFTVFAPTDAAFAALERQRPGILPQLLQPENRDTLVKILTYHVVPGRVLSSNLTSGQVNTVEKGAVNVQVSGNRVTVNNARVTQADISASNGVIHVIDKVLLPPDLRL
jgi:uncharacterized surface protein with fasciclin (FAS1) repeats